MKDEEAMQVLEKYSGKQFDPDVVKAFRAGSELLENGNKPPMPLMEDWTESLDNALPALDRLRPAAKGKLVKALIATVMADNRVAVTEMELLRVVCAIIHVPLPMISGSEAA